MNDILIQQNYEMAYNFIPELLFTPNMIYVDGIFNNKTIKLFIDTGAQISIMSLNKAHSLGIEEFIDKSYNGMADGIGSQKIIGRIHYLEIQIDNYIIPMSIDVVENINDKFDILVGLNVLYANGINVDIKNQCLIFNENKISFSKN
jgi:DNA damage-inducible protein 1